MITCGIEFSKNKAIFSFLEKDENGIFFDISGKKISLELVDDENHLEVKEFQKILYSLLETYQPQKIGIVKRQKKGKFAGGAISFKLEGILQLYPNCDILLIPATTIKSFNRKKEMELLPRFKYQENSLLLAWYLINN